MIFLHLFVHMQSKLPLCVEKILELLAPLSHDTPMQDSEGSTCHGNSRTLRDKLFLLYVGILTSSFDTSSFKTASKTNSCFSTYSVRSTWKVFMYHTLETLCGWINDTDNNFQYNDIEPKVRSNHKCKIPSV